jgi:hypothetical protein
LNRMKVQIQETEEMGNQKEIQIQTQLYEV